MRTKLTKVLTGIQAVTCTILVISALACESMPAKHMAIGTLGLVAVSEQFLKLLGAGRDE